MPVERKVTLKIQREGSILKRLSLEHHGHYIIGRAPDCAIRLGESYVSKRHCCITIDPDGVFIRDLNSANGTEVNGMVLSGRNPPEPAEPEDDGAIATVTIDQSPVSKGKPQLKEDVPLTNGSLVRIGDIEISVGIEEMTSPEDLPLESVRSSGSGASGVLQFDGTMTAAGPADALAAVIGSEYPCRLLQITEAEARVVVSGFPQSLYMRLRANRIGANIRVRIDTGDSRDPVGFFGNITWPGAHQTNPHDCRFLVQVRSQPTAEQLRQLRAAINSTDMSDTR